MTLITNFWQYVGQKIRPYADLDMSGKKINDVSISTAQWGILGAAVEWTAWVPTLTGGGANLSGYSNARYFRIGKICFFEFVANAKNIAGGGSIHISLPFSSANTERHQIFGQINNGVSWAGMPFSAIDPGDNYINLYKTVAGGVWAGSETGVYIQLSGFFEIA